MAERRQAEGCSLSAENCAAGDRVLKDEASTDGEGSEFVQKVRGNSRAT